jgi:hypothetical protein
VLDDEAFDRIIEQVGSSPTPSLGLRELMHGQDD